MAFIDKTVARVNVDILVNLKNIVRQDIVRDIQLEFAEDKETFSEINFGDTVT